MPTETPIQKFLPMRIELLIPTMDLAAARGALGAHENDIKEMIDDGRLAWAWDIARVENGDRRELRILTRCVRDLQQERTTDLDEAGVVALLYGKERPFILGKHFYAAWNCDSGHMCNLVEDKTLKLVAGTSYDRGRGNTPCITWASAVAFLKTRRLL